MSYKSQGSFRYVPEDPEETWGGLDAADAMDYDTPMEGESYGMHKEYVTTEEIQRWSSWTRPFPLPDYMTPTGGRLFDTISDEVLMETPPHLIVHLQRTAAQGGLQVISPRQTPFSCLMGRTVDRKRDLGDHVVGSTAAIDDRWPTVDDADFSELLPDEPLPVSETEGHLRTRTRTEPLTSAAHLMKDPILACLIKGRAVIDLQQRDDVMGDSARLTDLLARAWSIAPEDLRDLDSFSLGIDGPLLRHAIKADDVFPVVHAPIHQTRCVSVGSNEATRDTLPLDSAMDWRRMRVFCEAVFLLSTSIEGFTLRQIRAIPPPGDPTAPMDRPNILAFRPAPCVAWSFESRSFSVVPETTQLSKMDRAVPPEVMSALARYVEVVKPVSHAMSRGHNPRAKATAVMDVVEPSGETLTSAYTLVTRSINTGGARGKSSVRAVRNYVYEAISGAPAHERLRITRYIHIAKSEVKTHLGLDVVPDQLINVLAIKFLKIGETIRLRIAAEATKRCGSIEQWWRDICSQVPERYANMAEGTMGWSKVAMWMIFRGPTHKWEGLEKKMHYDAVRDSSISSIGGVPLPPGLGTIQRVLAASRAFVKSITSAYYGYYIAVADVGHGIADVMESNDQPRSAAILREACHLWHLRARALRGTNVEAIEKRKMTPSVNHLRVCGPFMDLLVVPAPYRAFRAYKGHILATTTVHKSVRDQILRFDDPKISKLFQAITIPMAPAKQSLLTRYLLDPTELAKDMERAWTMLAQDVAHVICLYAAEKEKPPTTGPLKLKPLNIDAEAVPLISTKRKATTGKTYFDLICYFDPDDVDWAEDIVSALPEIEMDLFYERQFESFEELKAELERMESEGSADRTVHETVG